MMGLMRRGGLLPMVVAGVAIAMIAVVVGFVVGAPRAFGGHHDEVAQVGGRDEGGSESERERERLREPVAGPVSGPDAGEMAAAAAARVEQLAYPRSYVTSRAALRSAAATERVPGALSATDFRAAVSAPAVRAQAGGAWSATGPVGLTKPPNSPWPSPPIVSGRVTALAIDPACGQPGRGCRLWMGSAGGGVWRTADATAPDPQWVAVSADIPSGAIGSLALDPNDATGNTIYAGTGEANGSSDSEAGVGLYRSTDGGDHWALVSGSRAFAMDRAIGAIAVRPGSPGTILVGTARGRHGAGSRTNGSLTPPNAPALGLYRTTDGGSSFTVDLAPAQPSGDPALRTDTPRGGVTQVQFDPVDADIAYAAVLGSGVWRRAANGTWALAYTPQDPADQFVRTSFAPVAHGATVHMYVMEGGDAAGSPSGAVRRTLDAHAAPPSWTLLSDAAVTSNLFGAKDVCGQQCWYDQFIAATANGVHDVVWAGGSMQYDEVLNGLSNGRGVIRSPNAEAAAAAVEWYDVTSGADDAKLGSHPDLHAIAFNPADADQAFVGSDGGMVRTDDGFTDASTQCTGRGLAGSDLARCQQLLSSVPVRVTGINSRLSTLQLQAVASTPVEPGALMTGYQDNGTAVNGTTTWIGVIGGDGGPPAFDAAGAGIAYHQYYGGTVEVSYDHGDPGSWLSIYDPMDASGESVAFYAPLEGDPVVEGTTFSGWEHVWRTTDRGGDRAFLAANCGESAPSVTGCGDFAPLGPNLTDVALGDRSGGTVSAIARSAGDTTTLWAATSKGRVFVSTNVTAAAAAVTFTRLDTASAVIPTRFPSGIQVDPADPNHAWVSYAGYNAYTPATPGHLFEVRFDPATGGSTWADRSYDLGDVPLRDLAYDPLLGDLYAATDWSVVRLPGGATAWMDAGTAIPKVATYGLTIEPGQRVLYAATHGRGVYSLALPDPAPGPAPPAPMPAAEQGPGPVAPATSALDARVVLPPGRRVTVGPGGAFIIRIAATRQSGTGTITLDGALPPTSGRPTSARLAVVTFRFTRNHTSRVRVALPPGSRRALGRAGRMNTTVQVRMRGTSGQTASAAARLVLQASPRLRAASR